MRARLFAVLVIVAALCGVGAPFASGATLSVTPNPLNVGNAIILPPNAASKPGIIKITNLGAKVTILSITSDHPQFVPNLSCVKVLNAHEICGFTITFTPDATGPFLAKLTITDNSGGSAHKVALKGFGKQGKLTINPDPVNFGNVYVKAAVVHTVTLLNNNPVQMTLGALGFSDSDFSETDNCAGAIAAHGKCEVWLSLAVANPGLLSGGTMSVSDNAAGSPQHVPLNGNVLPLPACAAGTSGTFTFNNTNMLARSRINHTATTLKNGMVLIVGGTGNAETPHAELYNFKICKFSLPGSNTPNSRQNHTATLLADGRVLIAGGEKDTATKRTVVATAEIFDPNANGGAGGFFPTGSMHFAREFHTASLLANGKVLIAGGDLFAGLTHAEIYNPATGTFRLTAHMNFAREDHTATGLSNGNVLIAGGDDFGTISATTEIFDSSINGGIGGFGVGPTMSAARRYAAATLITIGNDTGWALIAGGYTTGLDASDTAELFISLGGFGAPFNTMSVGRQSPAVTRLLDGNVLVAGGSCNPVSTGGQRSADLLMVTGPNVGNFEPTGNLVDGLVNHAAALLPDGQVLVTGGLRFNVGSCANPCVSANGCSANATNDAELYHP
jgi:hypothetical protein